jgi:hypothetical protein
MGAAPEHIGTGSIGWLSGPAFNLSGAVACSPQRSPISALLPDRREIGGNDS